MEPASEKIFSKTVVFLKRPGHILRRFSYASVHLRYYLWIQYDPSKVQYQRLKKKINISAITILPKKYLVGTISHY